MAADKYTVLYPMHRTVPARAPWLSKRPFGTAADGTLVEPRLHARIAGQPDVPHKLIVLRGRQGVKSDFGFARLCQLVGRSRASAAAGTRRCGYIRAAR
jgi:hypothetical protein